MPMSASPSRWRSDRDVEVARAVRPGARGTDVVGDAGAHDEERIEWHAYGGAVGAFLVGSDDEEHGPPLSEGGQGPPWDPNETG